MSRYPGLAQHMAGGRSMNRQFDAQTIAGVLQDMRTDDWFGKALLLTAEQRSAAKERGELKLIRVTVTDGSVTVWLKDAPGDQKTTATTSWGVSRTLQNYDGLSSFYLDTGGAPATFEIYVEFDIARAEDVS